MDNHDHHSFLILAINRPDVFECFGENLIIYSEFKHGVVGSTVGANGNVS